MTRTTSPIGVGASLGASVLFALLSYWAVLLTPLSGGAVLGWRIVTSLPVAVVTVFALGMGDQVITGLRRLRSPKILLGTVVAAAVLSVQWWLFMWAPANGRALQVSLGFFVLPIAMVVVGRFGFRERLSRPQRIAVVLACFGAVGHLISAGSISWEVLVIALGFTFYFTLRRVLGTADAGGTICDVLFMLPVGIWFVATSPSATESWATNPNLWWAVPGLGVISGVATVAYFWAAELLPFGLFGLLSYVEPVLLVFVALAIGSPFAPIDLLGYGPIWLAVLVLAGEAALKVRRAPASG
ncbi:EamA family transporter RarD [Enemella sp. A6]|uniref:EamA family transporter RarD n=1 Tax=Enemella sp. A6 TaxID=3440152 RepID=UPI003EBDEDE8